MSRGSSIIRVSRKSGKARKKIPDQTVTASQRRNLRNILNVVFML